MLYRKITFFHETDRTKSRSQPLHFELLYYFVVLFSLLTTNLAFIGIIIISNPARTSVRYYPKTANISTCPLFPHFSSFSNSSCFGADRFFKVDHWPSFKHSSLAALISIPLLWSFTFWDRISHLFRWSSLSVKFCDSHIKKY